MNQKSLDKQKPKKLDWEKEFDKIMDKNTTNLTKTGDKDFNPPEIISFDKVVFEKYEATLELKELITSEKQSSYTQAVNDTIEKVKEMVKEIRTGYGKQGQSALDFLSVKINQLETLKGEKK